MKIDEGCMKMKMREEDEEKSNKLGVGDTQLDLIFLTYPTAPFLAC